MVFKFSLVNITSEHAHSFKADSLHTEVAFWYVAVYQARLSLTLHKVSEGLADVISTHSSQLVPLKLHQ